MGIEFERDEYTAALPNWKLVDDMVDEANLGDHLLELNPTDKSKDNKARKTSLKSQERHGSKDHKWTSSLGRLSQ